ncbi:MAG: phosphoenolpyruvate--protein phosphotransferase [Micrococcaceae bacterium]
MSSETLKGTGVGSGLAVAPLIKMGDKLPEPEDKPSELSPEEENTKAEAALDSVATELRERGEKAGGDAQQVLEAQALMAEDPGLLPLIKQNIDDGKTAERGIYEAFVNYRAMLEAAGGYMAERVSDLDDVRQRAIAAAMGVPAPGVPEPDHEFILAAQDLAPADTALLDLDKVKGIVTEHGGPTSHTAILARAKGIPAMVGVAGILDQDEKSPAILDAGQGTIVINPDKETIAAAQKKADELTQRTILTEGPGQSKDGHHIPLYANVGSVKDAQEAIDAGVEGIGLFRTEFLFLDSDTPPSYDEQYKAYKDLFDEFPKQKVVARTLDAGADKPLSFLNFDEEPNPALGARGIRICRETPEVFDTQLKALGEAAKDSAADVYVMAPMIVDTEDTQYLVEECEKFGIKKPGVMIETPSAALNADAILQKCEFASIGTNDLTQYTMAADRMLASTAKFQTTWNPAVLKLIQVAADAGNKNKKTVGICGEAAADPQLALVLAGLGVGYLSMSASAVAEVRTTLAYYTFDQMKDMADAAVNSSNAEEAQEAVKALLK